MFKTLLVHLDAHDASQRRLDAALRFAGTHDAHVSGLYPIADCVPPAGVGMATPPELYQTLRDNALADARASQQRFDEALMRAGVNGDWRSVEGGAAARHVADAACCADLVVIGQTLGQDPPALEPGFASEVVLRSPAPVLILPAQASGDVGIGGACALIGWNDSREAARAVRDALPLLVEAGQVIVATVAPEPAAAAASVDELLEYLRLHGVNASVEVCVGVAAEAGERLLDAAARRRCDLVVSGGYGHSRLREVLLGGVTRHLLRYAGVPVLMSH